MLFLGGCMPTRALFVFGAYKLRNNKKIFPWLGVVALLIGVGFLYQHISGRKTGAEVFGGKIWWDDMRSIHALMYITFAILCFINTAETRKYAYVPLLIDIVFGISAWGSYHYSLSKQ